MFILCDILIPVKIEIEIDKQVDPATTEVTANLVKYHISNGNAHLINVYPYLGEIETSYGVENSGSLHDGTYCTISLEKNYSENWRENKTDIFEALMQELGTDNLFLRAYSDKHITFIKDYD